MSLNAHYLFIFKNPRDQSQITHLAKQMFPGNVKYLQSAYKQATDRPHGYLMLDTTQKASEFLRLRSGILPGELHATYIQK